MRVCPYYLQLIFFSVDVHTYLPVAFVMQTYIKAFTDCKTTDGYVLRVFCIGFTERMSNQVKKTCYAQQRQVKTIRRKMVEIMNKEVSNCELKELVNKLIPDTIADDIRKSCNSVYPLKDVYIRKVCSLLNFFFYIFFYFFNFLKYRCNTSLLNCVIGLMFNHLMSSLGYKYIQEIMSALML